MGGGRNWAGKERAMRVGTRQWLPLPDLTPGSGSGQHGTAQFTACRIVSDELSSPIVGSGAFPGKRGRVSPSPGDIPELAWLPLSRLGSQLGENAET